QDAAGSVSLCDRKRDMIISGGVNIYPAEIESVLIGMPGVRDCAVFGIPDEEFGESLAAHLEADAGAALTASTRASHVARDGRLDGLAVDALHMMAFVDTAPADQLRWDREALALALRSD